MSFSKNPYLDPYGNLEGQQTSPRTQSKPQPVSTTNPGEKLDLREIYANGGGLLVTTINALGLFV